MAEPTICSQCGQPFESWACGPTHALIRHEREGVNRKLKILFVGDAACSTGFALCTHEVCNRLHANGHEISILGINAWGDPHNYPYTIYPCVNPLDRSRMVCGEERLPKLIARLQPDAVVILQDPWNIQGYLTEIDDQLGAPVSADFKVPTMIGWLAVDAKNQASGKQLNRLDHVVTWTQFGIDELRAGGYTGSHSIIGLGVDTTVYYPIDKAEARREIFSRYGIDTSISPDSFIIGVVGRNQYRKRLDLTLEYYAEWIKSYDVRDAHLYLHVAPTGESGCDIPKLLRYYGISAIVSEPSQAGQGATIDEMRSIYNLFDLYWTTTQGEGWGLPALEAMACGVPVLAPDWSGLREWAEPAAVLVSCTSTALNAPINRAPYTIGGIADKYEMIAALDKIYRHRSYREQLSALGLRLAKELTWDRVGEQWESLLQSISQSFRWSKRTSTMDEITIREVYNDNCYHIPDDLSDYTVIDVGASIGAFSRLCLERGARKLIAIEPDNESFELLKKNLESFPQAEIIHGAVVGDMCTADSLAISPTNYRGNFRMTGGQNVFESLSEGKELVSAIKIGDLISDIKTKTDLEAYPILLKLDCEGSEYQIVYSDLPWDLIAIIVGETHTIGKDHPFVRRFAEIGLTDIPHDHESLVKRLTETGGYDVVSEDFYRTACGLLNFKATNKARFSPTMTDLMISPEAIEEFNVQAAFGDSPISEALSRSWREG